MAMKFVLAWLSLVAAPGCVSAGLLRRAANATQADAAAAAELRALESKAIQELNEAYGNNANSEEYAGYDIDEDERAAKEMVKKTGDEKSGTYGEVQPDGVASMLRAVGAKPGMRYYDLGSGTGKTVALAWLLGLDATGVELSDVRYKASCKALAKLPEQPPITAGAGQRQGLRFKLENIEKTDFSDADIIFANSVLLTNHTLEILADRARTMKVGAKLITYKGLPGPGFRTDGKVTVPCSWFPMVPYVVQTVVAPMQAEVKPVTFTQVGRKVVRRHKVTEADDDDDEQADEAAEEDGEEMDMGDGAEEGDEATDADEAVDAEAETEADAEDEADTEDEADAETEADSEEEPSAEESAEEPAAGPQAQATMVCEK